MEVVGIVQLRGFKKIERLVNNDQVEYVGDTREEQRCWTLKERSYTKKDPQPMFRRLLEVAPSSLLPR